MVRLRVAPSRAYGAAVGVAPAVAKAYNERLSRAKNTDQVTKGFIDNALTIHGRMLRKPSLKGDTS